MCSQLLRSFQLKKDRFRMHSHSEFQAACGMRGDLYDVLGHMRVVNDVTLSEALVKEVVVVIDKRRATVHIHVKEGPVMRLYLWTKAAYEYYSKFTSGDKPPSVLLVTTVDSKNLGGNLALCSMSSSRVFFDTEVAPAKEYLEWLVSNSVLATQVSPIEVTRVESMTI